MSEAPDRVVHVIAAVRGSVLSKGVSWLVVDVSGVGYRVEVPTEFAARHHVGDRVFAHTQLVVRQDAMTLFGFETAEALDMFNILIGVSGVGPVSYTHLTLPTNREV